MKRILSVALLALVALAAPSAALDPGTWLFKVGGHSVAPKSDNGVLEDGALDIKIGSSVRPTVMLEYIAAKNFGIEILASWPFEHTIEANKVEVATVQQLPPTVSLQYHFDRGGKVVPYLGVGFNYTMFFSEDTTGPLKGADLSLSSSFGFAVHAGIDFVRSGPWSFGIDARYIDLKSDVSVNGSKIGKVNVDPFAYGAYLQYRF